MVTSMLDDLICNIWMRNRMHADTFVIKIDHTWLEDALYANAIRFQPGDTVRLKTLHTMGASIISSYARSPYFSAGLFGRRTMKSYKLSATSPCEGVQFT